MQVLYHWNFGPPLLEEGSRFAAPLRTITPATPAPWRVWAGTTSTARPSPARPSRCYFYELHAQSGPRQRDPGDAAKPGGDKAVVLRFHKDQLPCFTLWKNTAGLRDGYVTGLEPATNYPNPRPFEKARNRVVTLPVDGRYVVETTLEVLTTGEAVAAVESEIEILQSQGHPTINPGPREPFAAEG